MKKLTTILGAGALAFPPCQNSCRLDRIVILGVSKELMWLAMDKHSRIVR